MMSVKQPNYPLLESALEATVGFLARSFRRYRAMQELRNIGANEVSAIARDLGVTPTELSSLTALGAGFPTRLQNMLSLLKIDERKICGSNSALVRDMQKVCTFCQNKRQCSHELRTGRARAHYHAYCPNSTNFDAVTIPTVVAP